MKEDRSKASWGLRLAALLCLGAVVFAAIRIIGSNAVSSFSEFWREPPYYPKYMIGIMLPFGLFASLYILITGRVPSTAQCPVELDENAYKSRFDKIGLAVIWTAILAFCGVVIYLCFFFE